MLPLWTSGRGCVAGGRMLLRGGQPANMSAAKIDWLPAEGGHGQLPQGGGGPGDVGLGVRGLRWGRALVLEELGVRGGE